MLKNSKKSKLQAGVACSPPGKFKPEQAELQRSISGEPFLLKVPEVRQLLGGISSKSVSRLEKRGLLRSTNLFRHKLYLRDEVEALLEKLREGMQ